MGTVESEVRAGVIDRSNTLVVAAYALIVLLVGCNAVAVRFTVAELPPFWGAALRFTAAALIFWFLVLVRRAPLPKGRALVGVLLYGFLNFGASYAFIYWGIRSLSAGLLQVILALTPLLTFFAAYVHGLESFRWRGLAGAVLAVAGIAVAFFDGRSGSAPIWALVAIILSAVCISEATVVVKFFPRSDLFAANALGMTTGALTLIVLSLIRHEPWRLPQKAATWFSVAYLVVMGSVVVFWLFLFLLGKLTASVASYQFVLFPFVTVFVAGWLAGETPNVGFVIGGALVLAGVWIGALSRRTG